jgi:isopentenyldiphosphate isomerase
MASLMARVAECNTMGDGVDPTSRFIKFNIEGITYGYIPQTLISLFVAQSEVFAMKDGLLTLTDSVVAKDLLGRTAAVGTFTEMLKKGKIVTGWRDELLPVVSSFSGQPALLMERAAVPLFGFKAFGVHVNGYVRDKSTGQVAQLWVAKRAKNKSSFPGMLDHIVAGGQPYGISPADNVVKECGEEANIPPQLAGRASATGAVSYMNIDQSGRLKRDTLFCYDLELPHDFVPTPVDGEVESFELQSLEWVLRKVAKGGADGYKPNCNLVVIDFLIRHGVISPESNGYLELLDALQMRPSNIAGF